MIPQEVDNQLKFMEEQFNTAYENGRKADINKKALMLLQFTRSLDIKQNAK